MITGIGLVLLVVGVLGALVMLIMALRSAKWGYRLKCKNCGAVTEIPRQEGEYACKKCGTPLGRVRMDS